MHANVQLRHNPELGAEAPYYCLKKSYCDIRGNVHSLIVLNVGFEPALRPIQVRRIAAALTERFENRNRLPPDKPPYSHCREKAPNGM